MRLLDFGGGKGQIRERGAEKNISWLCINRRHCASTVACSHGSGLWGQRWGGRNDERTLQVSRVDEVAAFIRLCKTLGISSVASGTSEQSVKQSCKKCQEFLHLSHHLSEPCTQFGALRHSILGLNTCNLTQSKAP